MSRFTAIGAALAFGLVVASPAAGALEVRASITPKRPHALEPAIVELRTFAPLIRADGSCCRLRPWSARSYPFRVEAVSPTGKTSRVRVRWTRGNEWRGVVRFSTRGRWTIELPQFQKSLAVNVRPPVPTPVPTGFGPLGRPGCTPPSPAHAFAGGLRNVFGTAVGGEQAWALPVMPKGASWGRNDAAVFDGLVGKEFKIVFATTFAGAPFHAVGPDGATLQPIWRQGHVGPTWVGIPGHQWGAGFVFPEPGCWKIRVGPRGDVWMLIRS